MGRAEVHREPAHHLQPQGTPRATLSRPAQFDLRIWVLVTDWNPLTVWFWNKPYVRFSAADYDETNLEDRFVHLTNNSVGKHSTQEAFGEGNMWYSEELSDHLRVCLESDIFA